VFRFKKGIVQAVTTLLAFVVGIMLGAIVVGKLQSVFTNLNVSEDAKNVINAVFTQTWAAYGLLVVMPIIVVAAIILGLLGYGRSRK
jgi:hypothetical protein